MSIVLQGSTSGSITLQEPAIAGSTVLSLPATTGTVLTSASPASDLPSSIKGLAFSAYNSNSQTFNALTTTVAVFNTEFFDTDNCFNTSNYRFTPTIAGYYQINSQIAVTANTSNEITINLRQNANTVTRLGRIVGNSATTVYFGGSTIVYMNGSTDFLDIAVYTASQFTSENTYSLFSGALVRVA